MANLFQTGEAWGRISLILMMEPSAPLRDFYRRVFKASNPVLKLLSVPTTLAAWESLEEMDADALVVDLEQPGFDCLKFLRALRRHPRRRGLPVVFVSDTVDYRQLRELSSHPLVTLLMKPARPEDLARALQSLLRPEMTVEEARLTLVPAPQG